MDGWMDWLIDWLIDWLFSKNCPNMIKKLRSASVLYRWIWFSKWSMRHICCCEWKSVSAADGVSTISSPRHDYSILRLMVIVSLGVLIGDSAWATRMRFMIEKSFIIYLKCFLLLFVCDKLCFLHSHAFSNVGSMRPAFVCWFRFNDMVVDWLHNKIWTYMRQVIYLGWTMESVRENTQKVWRILKKNSERGEGTPSFGSRACSGKYSYNSSLMAPESARSFFSSPDLSNLTKTMGIRSMKLTTEEKDAGKKTRGDLMNSTYFSVSSPPPMNLPLMKTRGTCTMKALWVGQLYS